MNVGDFSLNVQNISSTVKGYIKITVEGYYIERFLNKCNLENIKIWNTKHVGECILELCIYAKDLKRVKKILKITNCRIKIIDKKGMPFVLFKYRKRKIFLFFPFLIFFVLYMFSLHIWNIEINGDLSYEDSKIVYEVLNENGVREGCIKNNIDTDKLINQIRLKSSNISWVRN